MSLRCKPNDLCVIVPGPIDPVNEKLRPAFGVFVTVAETCPGNPTAWHYKGCEPLVMCFDDNYYLLHAIPDENLKPIRGSTPGKAVSTRSPKKQLAYS